ncbi:hypothetical protein SS50377_20954 [Spironucleus salmonicida]|uniref:Uncharacterized protein n=1 Tax=Spironucleus salmonicida TaxID=348837 RepID=V6LGE2_9EUKA|nr:hypothetical protein SS50377_20954 [Spironucleus salmonicida]|eukprot:EST43625.1 Hypothetical protein SS50377_16668 [Spironucleus salmonicida]
MSSDEYSSVSTASQRPKVKTILQKREHQKISIKNYSHSPKDALPILNKQDIKADLEKIQNEQSQTNNTRMMLDSQISVVTELDDSNITISYRDQLSRIINSDSGEYYSDEYIETEEEEIIITGKEQVYAQILENFLESRFDIKHITEVVRDLENRVQSIYDNALYVLLAQQRKWYKLYKK